MFMAARQSRDLGVVARAQDWFELNLELARLHEKYLVDDLLGALAMRRVTIESHISYNLVSNYLYEQTCDSVYLEKQMYYADLLRAGTLKRRLIKRSSLDRAANSDLKKGLNLFRNTLDCETEYLLKQEEGRQTIDCRVENKANRILLDLELRGQNQLRAFPAKITLEQIRSKLLQKNKTLFYINSGGSYADIITVITPTDHTSYYARYDKRQLDEMIERLFASIDGTTASNDTDELGDLADQLHRFYQAIFGPAEHLLTEELILFSDGPLARIPYGALLTAPVEDPTDWGNWPFFVRKYQFTLAYSLQTQLRLQEQAPVRRTKLLAYAPLFTKGFAYRYGGAASRYGFSALENNIDEAVYAARCYNGQTALGEAATKERFLAEASEYDILHLATHAKRNVDFDLLSFVAFGEEEEDRLYAGHIFGLDLPAELVVLSACETARGYDLIGEGPMSLSRAFAAAGAKSTVSTLWRVSDRESAQLVGGFYDYLAAGAPKDAALRQAQLAMIDGGSHRAAHPFYWSGYILEGDTRPLPSTAGWDWRLVGGGVVLLLGMGCLALVLCASVNQKA